MCCVFDASIHIKILCVCYVELCQNSTKSFINIMAHRWIKLPPYTRLYAHITQFDCVCVFVYFSCVGKTERRLYQKSGKFSCGHYKFCPLVRLNYIQFTNLRNIKRRLNVSFYAKRCNWYCRERTTSKCASVRIKHKMEKSKNILSRLQYLKKLMKSHF